jgi:hypothetical protein
MRVYGLLDRVGLFSLSKEKDKKSAFKDYMYSKHRLLDESDDEYCAVSGDLSDSQHDIMRTLNKSKDSIGAAKAFIQFVTSDPNLEVSDIGTWEELQSLFKTKKINE